jgi:hypothetical protein
MPQTAQRRKFKSFREVTKPVRVDRQVRRLAEALDLTKARGTRGSNPTVDMNYFTISAPMTLSNDGKLSQVLDKFLAIEGSDVVLLGIWVFPAAWLKRSSWGRLASREDDPTVFL